LKESLYKGIIYASIASIFWGLPTPIYFNELKSVNAIEVVCHRAIWSFLFLLLIIILLGRFREFINIFSNKTHFFCLSLTGILISINWLGFILSININKLQDASMGYYISPIISIGLGYLFFKEKMTTLKKISLLLMILSILILLISIKTIPYIAFIIAFSWSIYGLVRKKIKMSAEIGLIFESGFVTIFALIYLFVYNQSDFVNENYYIKFLLIFTGIITIFPLFVFNIGLKYLPLGLAGSIFYLAPTFFFITSIVIFNEQLLYYKLISFIIIWIAVIIFIYDNLKIDSKISENKTQLPS
tara:strand:- start:18481 stop:19383 length:903 start_codon:yes stop_codon:yes gene_type:complete